MGAPAGYSTGRGNWASQGHNYPSDKYDVIWRPEGTSGGGARNQENSGEHVFYFKKKEKPEPEAAAPAAPSLAPSAPVSRPRDDEGPPISPNAPISQEEIDEITPPAGGLETTVLTGPVEDPLNALDEPTLEDMDDVTGEEIIRPTLAADTTPTVTLEDEEEDEQGTYLWGKMGKKARARPSLAYG